MSQNKLSLIKDNIFIYAYLLDLFLTLDTPNGTKFAVYDLPISKLTLIKEYYPPPDVEVLLLSLFADIGNQSN